jgi:hypothetical protein
MSTDTDERPGEGLDDALRRRLEHLGRSATAGSLPWPAVDHAIRRRRRTAVGLAALATAAVALAGTVATGGFTDSATTTPADRGVTRPVPLPDPPPWPVPSAPYVEVYENVAVNYPLVPEACNTTHSVDLHDPATLVKGPYDPADTRPVAFSITCEQNLERDSNLAWNVPTAIPPPRTTTTAEDCAAAFRNSPENTGSQAPGGVVCLLAPADPSRGRPLMIVRLEYTQDSTMAARAGLTHLSYKLSAWSGGPPTQDGGLPQLNPPTQTESAPSISPEPPVVTVSAPYRAAYEDVPLQLPGKAEACAGEESFLHLHVPEVSPDLAPSDAMQTSPCLDRKAELQLGTARGAVLQDDDVTPEECAAALASDTPKVWKFAPVVGSTLCMVAESHDGDQPPAKLVALTVTEVDGGTGAFELSASAWTGTVSKSRG